MAKATAPTIPYGELQLKCKELGIKDWPEYQQRYKEIPGAKKTLHAAYKEWSGNVAFFGETARKVRVKKAVAEGKTASVAKTKRAKKADAAVAAPAAAE